MKSLKRCDDNMLFLMLFKAEFQMFKKENL